MADPTPLTVDEAVEAIVTSAHPEASKGDLALDAALIQALRAGKIDAARREDGKLAFRKRG